jgi:protoheme IX farnesyltransferase
MGLLRWLRVIRELTKLEISLVVTLSAATGYFLFTETFSPGVLLPMGGVLLLAFGASALNQVEEARSDGRMERTRGRPIPAGRIPREWALFLAFAFIGAGLYLLASVETHVTVLLALGVLALLWYNGVYVLLKRYTAFAAVPGSLVGAIPPVMGWVAGGGLASDPTILGLAFFFGVWQIPHFWLLAVRFRRDYEKAGLPSLSRVFSEAQIGRITAVWILAVAALGILMGIGERVGLPWRLGMLAASLWLAAMAIRILADRKNLSLARPAFRRINVYVLLVMVCLVGNAFW